MSQDNYRSDLCVPHAVCVAIVDKVLGVLHRKKLKLNHIFNHKCIGIYAQSH